MTEVPTSSDHPLTSDGPRRPRLLIFDVNETLSDMAPLSARFVDVGAPEDLARLWFAEVLRDGFALTAAGGTESFAAVAAEALRVRLHGQALDRPIDDAVDHVMQGFAELAVHPDVVEGIRALSDLDVRLATLSNGSSAVAETLLRRAGVRDRFERLLTVEDAGAWKPAARAYAYALQACGVEPMNAMLVAVHPWDVDGARRAGLATAWVNRASGRFPSYFAAPDIHTTSLVGLAGELS